MDIKITEAELEKIIVEEYAKGYADAEENNKMLKESAEAVIKEDEETNKKAFE